MGIWIRSQDKKTLIKSYEIYIVENKNSYVIRAKRTSRILGVYSTFERALEILDEIQKLDIENNPNIEISCYAYNLINITYNMPDEYIGVI